MYCIGYNLIASSVSHTTNNASNCMWHKKDLLLASKWPQISPKFHLRPALWFSIDMSGVKNSLEKDKLLNRPKRNQELYNIFHNDQDRICILIELREEHVL